MKITEIGGLISKFHIYLFWISILQIGQQLFFLHHFTRHFLWNPLCPQSYRMYFILSRRYFFSLFGPSFPNCAYFSYSFLKFYNNSFSVWKLSLQITHSLSIELLLIKISLLFSSFLNFYSRDKIKSSLVYWCSMIYLFSYFRV